MAMIIDATDLIVGRIATVVAKKALLGETIDIVNCQDAVVSGKRASIFKEYKQTADRGVPLKGPYFPKQADRIVRRTIRGMIGWKTAKGKVAYKRIMCHVGVPVKFQGKTLETIENAHVKKLPNLRYVKIKYIAEHLKGSRQ